MRPAPFDLQCKLYYSLFPAPAGRLLIMAPGLSFSGRPWSRRRAVPAAGW